VVSRHFASLLSLALSGCANPDLTQFEKTLAANDSATLALGHWCDARELGDPAKITAIPVVGERHAIPKDVRSALKVGPAEAIGYRHVLLTCGDTTMSDARNWYVPARLTPAMNRTLGTTRQPFGKVVAPLEFTRERLESVRGRAPGCPQGTVLSHRALLKTPDGSPISFVLECYTRANIRR